MAELLLAEARVLLADPARAILAMAARFEDHARVARTPSCTVLESPRFGRMELKADGGHLVVACTCETASALAFAKMAAADAIERAAVADCPPFSWSGALSGSRALPFFREMTVVSAAPVTPHMRRVVLAGDAAHFASDSLHVRVLIPPAGRAPVWPHADPTGRMVWPKAPDALTPRVYTVRHVDTSRGEIAIDVVLHAGAATPGADWARGARPGDRVGLLGPGGAPFVPAGFTILAGDETALPAIARILENLPAGVRAVVRVEVEGAPDIQPLRSRAALDVDWLCRNGRPAGTTPLIEDAVRAISMPEDGSDVRVFAGCEQSAARRLRTYLTRDAGLDKGRLSVAAYWRLGHQGVDIGE